MASVRESAVVHDIVRILVDNDGEAMEKEMKDDIDEDSNMINRALSQLDEAGRIDRDTCLIDARTNMIRLNDDWG